MKSAEHYVNRGVLLSAKLAFILPLFAVVLVVNGALPGILSPTLGQAVWLTGFAKSIAEAPTFSIFAYDIGLPEPAAIAFGLPGALAIAAGLKIGLTPPDAYSFACALWLAVAFCGAYALCRHYGASAIYSALGATIWLTFPIVWQHAGYSMLSIGIALLPTYYYSVLIFMEPGGVKINRFLVFLFLVLISPFMDGYTFVMFASISLATLAFSFIFKTYNRKEFFIKIAMISLGFAAAFVLYSSYSPSQDFRADIGFFRAWSLDIAYLLSPTKGGLWLPDMTGQSTERRLETLFGDASVHITTFAIVPICLALLFLILPYGGRKSKILLFLVGIISLYLALGPSFKFNSLRPEGMNSLAWDPMPAESALGPTGTEFLWKHVPGLNNMRAVYRWMALALVGFWAVTMLAVSDRRMPRALAGGAVVLLLAYNLPHIDSMWNKYSDYRSAFLEMDRDIGELERVFHPGETVAFLPAANDFLINYLAPRLNIRSYNIGGDKNATLARRNWPKSLQEAANARTPEAFSDGVQRVLNGTADAVAIPYIDLLWSAHRWPSQKSRLEQVRPYIEQLERSGRVDIVDTANFAVVRLKDGAEAPSPDAQFAPTPATECSPADYVQLVHDAPMMFSSPDSVCGAGWSGAEHWGRWTDGDRASLHYALAEPAAGDVLEFDVRSYVSGEPPRQRVAVRVNSQAQPDWVFTREIPRQIARIPVPDGATELEIEFGFPDARSPQQAGESADPRLLGIGVGAICLSQADEACLRQ